MSDDNDIFSDISDLNIEIKKDKPKLNDLKIIKLNGILNIDKPSKNNEILEIKKKIKKKTKISLEENKKNEIFYKPLYIDYDKKNNEFKNIGEKYNNILHSNKLERIKKENKFISNKSKEQNFIEELENDYSEDSNNFELLNDDDENDKENEFVKWKIRELNRMLEFENLKNNRLKELEEIEKRKIMSNKEILKENKNIGKGEKPLKSDYKFMQKYYPSFGFYQDSNEEIFKRDYNIATGYDTFSKDILHSQYQSRGYQNNKKGKSKWTHLANEDTTNHNKDFKVDDKIFSNIIKKQVGYKKNYK